MVVVPPCRFIMGSPEDDPDRLDDEIAHEVTLTRAFAIATTPVTQALWVAVTGSNPSWFTGGPEAPRRPVEMVSWFDAVRFCNALSAKVGLVPAYRVGAGDDPTVLRVADADGFRLPTEVERECAARAGTRHVYAGGDDLDAVAWHDENSAGRTQPVRRMRANAWGLYDMSGNVGEWCWDSYDEYPAASVVDPTGPASGATRVKRGVSWDLDPQGVRVACRYFQDPGFVDNGLYNGLRLSRTVP